MRRKVDYQHYPHPRLRQLMPLVPKPVEHLDHVNGYDYLFVDDNDDRRVNVIGMIVVGDDDDDDDGRTRKRKTIWIFRPSGVNDYGNDYDVYYY